MPDDGGDYADDPVISAIGAWGPWQRKQFLLVGMFYIPCCFPVLNLLFMNAVPDFYCAMPEALSAEQQTVAQLISVEWWKEVSGQDNQSCQIRDLDYAAIM